MSLKATCAICHPVVMRQVAVRYDALNVIWLGRETRWVMLQPVGLHPAQRPVVRVTQIARQVLHGFTCLTEGASSLDDCPETLMDDPEAKPLPSFLRPMGATAMGQPTVTPNPNIGDAPVKALPPFLRSGQVDRASSSSSGTPSFISSDRPRPLK